MQLIRLGVTPYEEVWKLQREIFSGVIRGEQDDTLILTQHSHVYTFGRGADLRNFLLTDEALRARGAEKFEIERGGDVTYHGPGQIVGYPILNLAHFKEDLGWYLRSLEEVIINVLSEYGIVAFRVKGRTGVWTGESGSEEKICAIGVHASRWCTMHGFAFNVNTELSYFGNIIPCGIADRGVTSVQKLLGEFQDIDTVQSQVIDSFERVFEVDFGGDRTEIKEEQPKTYYI